MKVHLVIIVQAAFLLYCQAFPEPTKEQAKRFWQLYGECMRHASSCRIALLSYHDPLFDTPEYCELERSGTEILPLIYEAWNKWPCVATNTSTTTAAGSDIHAEAVRRLILGRLWVGITHQCSKDKIEIPWSDSFSSWLEGGEEFAEARATFLLDEIRAAIRENRRNDECRARGAMTFMGIFAFPYLFKTLETGQEPELLLSVFSSMMWESKRRVTDGRPEITREALLSWWRENRQRYALPKQSPNFKGTPGLEKWKRLEQPKSSR